MKAETRIKNNSPEFCEICFEISSDLLYSEESSEWICVDCSRDMMNERRTYEDHTRYSHEYYMGNCDQYNENDIDEEELV